jgi:guanylate kinase
MIILVGESASGKSTVEKELVKTYKLKRIISYTTRPPRETETDGVDYHFISKEKFHELEMNNFFAEIGNYRGWWYGSAVEDCTDDKVAVLTPHGLRQMKAIDRLNITSFYIKIPRRDRLIKILQRGDDIEECYRRSLSDVGQFDGIEDEVDYVIDNAGYDKSPMDIASVITVLMKERDGVNG